MRRNFTNWFIIILAWQLASVMFTFIGTSFFQSLIGLVELQPVDSQNKFFQYSISHLPLVESALFGFFFGNLFYVIHWATENTPIKKRSFGQVVCIQSVFYVLAFVLVFFMVSFVMSHVDLFPFDDYQKILLILEETPPVFYAFFSYFLIIIIIINFFIEVSKKFGPGNLWNLFIGKYHSPVVEHKIFMFLDLKDSTGYAEKLGHIEYSRLIQSCFLDLNTIVRKHNAQIYQYVGDEAVLMWDKDDKNAARDSIRLYYSFHELLLKKSDKYKSRYGLVPEFRAGINQGSVTAAEVGSIKREIAFHGDVLNTASRIQKVCNQYKKNLLASESFVELLDEVDEFDKVQIGYIALKGKAIPINIYSVELIK